MKKAKPKKINNNRSQAQKDRDYFGVVLEEINSKMKLTQEGYGLLSVQINKLDAKIEKNHIEINARLDNSVNETRNNFKTVFKYLSNVDDELKQIKAEITEIKKDNKTDNNRLQALEARVINLEKENIELRQIIQNHK